MCVCVCVCVCVCKIENRVIFRVLSQTFNVWNKSKITKDENGENVPYLEITEVVLVHCNIANNDFQQDSRVSYIHSFQISFLVSY